MLLERFRLSVPSWLASIVNFVELVFVWLSITSLRLIAPVSVAYLAASLYYLRPLGSKWLLIPTIPEALFFLLIYLPRSLLLQKQALHAPPPLTKDERELLFSRCLHHIPSNSPSLFPVGWFSQPDQVNRQNIVEWILFALFSSTLEDALDHPEWDLEIEHYVKRLELARGEAFPEGRAKNTKLMRLSFNRVPMAHRPLLWYFIVALVDHGSAFRLRLLGFRHYAPSKSFKVFPPRAFTPFSRKSAGGRLSYWYRPPPNAEAEDPKPTMILLHGIGIGVFPYIPFVSDVLKANPNQGILVIEVLQISMRMTTAIPSRTEIIESLAAIIDDLDLKRAVLVANSYGTLIASTILKVQNQGGLEPLGRIKNFILVDMAAFCLHLPDLARNFVYRNPGRQAYEWVIWYFSSQDADVSRTLSRHFFWHESALWKEDLLHPSSDATPSQQQRHVAVVLGGRDCILPAHEIKRYITGNDDALDRWVSEDGGLELLYFPEEDHATIFAGGHREPLLDLLERYNSL